MINKHDSYDKELKKVVINNPQMMGFLEYSKVNDENGGLKARGRSENERKDLKKLKKANGINCMALISRIYKRYTNIMKRKRMIVC